MVERFVAAPGLFPEHERELLLGWRNVVEGIFEVQGRDGDALVAENLVDELTIAWYSKWDRALSGRWNPAVFMIAPARASRAPVVDQRQLRVLSRRVERAAILRAACEMAMRHPKCGIESGQARPRTTAAQSIEHDRFVHFFGADFVVIPGAQLAERMRSFYTFCRDQAVSGLAASGKRPKHPPFNGPDYPADLVASDRSRSPTTRSRA